MHPPMIILCMEIRHVLLRVLLSVLLLILPLLLLFLFFLFLLPALLQTPGLSGVSF